MLQRLNNRVRRAGCLVTSLWLAGFWPAFLQATPPSASWPATWTDEFSGTSIDTSKWGYGSLPWGGQHHNDEYASYITPEDSYLQNGSLILRCRSGSFGGYPYSEGFVHSNGKMRYTYGYVEIRGRFPTGKGVWPAFWSLSDGWPPEFDIAEYFGSDDRMHMGLAYSSGGTQWDSSNFYGEGVSSWHTWSLEWGPGYAIWYKDGVQKKSIYASYVPSSSMYLILNSGMRWDADGSTPFPNYFEVDYCRKFDPPSVVINDYTTGTGLHEFNYVGSWSSSSQTGAFYNNNHWSSVANAYYEVAFHGTRVDLYGAKAPNHGIAAVSIDGGAEVLADFYASDRTEKALVWSKSGLIGGYHTLRVRVTGTRNANSSGNSIPADRVDVFGTPNNLDGILIGTSGSYNNGGNTKEMAMDGNLRTFFDAPQASGSWLGLDLGVQKRITKVLYSPRLSYASRMVGGRFQGANLSDFSDAVDLFTIGGEPLEGIMNEQTIANPAGFRYVRYLAPDNAWGNVAEVEFYGTEVGAGDGVWASNSDGTWSTASQWSGNSIATGAGFTADFSTLNISANRTVTLDSPRQIGTLRFGDTAGTQTWNLAASGGSELALDTGSSTVPTIAVYQNTATISASLAGINGFIKDGAGRLTLTGNNSLTGVLYVDGNSSSADDGSVCIANGDSVANLSQIQIRNNNSGVSTLQLDGTMGSVLVPADLTVNCRNNDVPTIQNLAGSNTLSGDIALNVGGNRFNLRSDAGLLVINGQNHYVGSLIGGRSYAFSGTGDHLVNGPILDSLNGAPISVTKSGTGTLTLAGDNTYGSTTAVSAGTLLVNGSLPAGGLTLSGGVTLGGNGVIHSAVTLPSGSTLAPGASMGHLTVNDSVTLQSGSTTRMEISKSPTTNDVLDVTGTLNYGGTLAVTNLAGTLMPGDTFTLFEGGILIGAFASYSLPPLDPGLGWDTTGLTNGTLAVLAVLPPSISTFHLTGEGSFELTGSGSAWGIYELQAATNLQPPVSWSPVTDVSADGMGFFQLIDPGATNHPQRFYRVKGP